MGITCITFVTFMGSGPSRNGGGGRAGGDFGVIYGHKVTQEDYVEARNEYYIFYRLIYNVWPDKNPNLSKIDQEREIYIHLLFNLKAANLGIYISEDEAAAAANDMLRAFGQNGQPVPIDTFIKQFLQPAGLTADDFKRYVRHDLIRQQLIQTMGLPGALITPQDAAVEYEREFREFSAQAVFFSASNYLSAVTVTPAAAAQYYTNYLADYRLPDRVQVSYVEFDLSNYLAQAKAEWARTNLEEVVEANYRQLGPDYFSDAKTPDAAREKIRELLVRSRALAEANKQANDFANVLFALEPVKPENLASVAKQKGLTVHLTAPFAGTHGPEEFDAPAEFTRAAFELTPDEPLAGPVAGPAAVYIVALARQLPSEIPSLDQIRARVMEDCRLREATLLARRNGTNFYFDAAIRMAAGKTFAQAAIAAGLQPQALPPFSLLTRELPELDDRAGLDQLKQTAFSTPVGHTSSFKETTDGGFILYVQSQLPADQVAMNTQMPQFIAQVRRAQQQQAFNEWLQAEANHQLRDISILRQPAAGTVPVQ